MKYRNLKSFLDYLVAGILIPILIVPMGLIWVLASHSTKKNGLFKQKRIGQYGKPFTIYKFRSMKTESSNSITTSKTHDITRFGQFLINSKIDEIPQLFNIINGTMSFVGPRPDVLGYADALRGEDRLILKVKPGITGPAQIKYKNEGELLNQQEDSKYYNDHVLWPDKVRINKKYVKTLSFKNDFNLLFKTIFG